MNLLLGTYFCALFTSVVLRVPVGDGKFSLVILLLMNQFQLFPIINSNYVVSESQISRSLQKINKSRLKQKLNLSQYKLQLVEEESRSFRQIFFYDSS